jgi:poly [ADP-ribose] polymerase
VVCAPTDISTTVQTAQRYGIKLIREAFFLEQLDRWQSKSSFSSSSSSSSSSSLSTSSTTRQEEEKYLLDEEDMTAATITEQERSKKPTKKRTRDVSAVSGVTTLGENESESESESESEPRTVKKTKTTHNVTVPVDSVCPLSTNNKVHIYLDDDNTPWAATLNQTNIAQNNNKFYVLQLLENTSTSQWWLWTRWGRVGLKGQSALLSFISLADAKAAFEKKYTLFTLHSSFFTLHIRTLTQYHQLSSKRFADKTANQWSDRFTFQSRPGKYTLIELDHEEKSNEEKTTLQKTAHNKAKETTHSATTHTSSSREKSEGVKTGATNNNNNEVKSTLPSSVYDLVTLLFDKSTMTHQLTTMQYDVQKMPLGKLKKSTLDKGMEVLKKIEKALQTGNKHELTTLSNEFYTLIPHAFGMSVPPVINTRELLHAKLQLLETLGDVHIANTLDQQSEQQRLQGPVPQHPIDAKYAQLKVKLTPLDPHDELYQLVVKYVQTTHGVTHNQYTLRVCDVFRVERDGERARFQQLCTTLFKQPTGANPTSDNSSEDTSAGDPNVHLLWHGSRISNFVSILSQGLRIAPPTAPSTGYMFGKGIYFADCCSKSANYCHVDLNKLNSPNVTPNYPDNIGTHARTLSSSLSLRSIILSECRQ